MNHTPRKRFGQNFLHDNQVIDQIVSSMHLDANDKVVEIGPGLGALTQPLLDQLASLHVIEIDRDLIAKLKQRNLPTLTVHEGDVLKTDWHDFVAQTQLSPLRIVGNLPYNIGTPLLLRLLDARDVIKDIHVMLQKEVVDRLLASVGTRAYGRLSVLMQSCFIVQAILDVSPASFNPPPKVDSAVVRLIPRKDCPDQSAVAALSNATRLAFANKRKTLRNNLRDKLSVEQIEAAGINPQARAETLSLEQFTVLAGLLKNQHESKLKG